MDFWGVEPPQKLVYTRRMNKWVDRVLLLAVAFNLLACGKEASREEAVGDSHDTARFSIKEPEAHLLAEQREQEMAPKPPRDCFEENSEKKLFDFPGVEDSCVIPFSEIIEGNYYLSAIDVQARHDALAIDVQFLRDLEVPGELSLTDEMRRNELWGVNPEQAPESILVDLNLPFSLIATGFEREIPTFGSFTRHQVTFDRVGDRVSFESFAAPGESSKGARLWELLPTHSNERLVSGRVPHAKDVIIFAKDEERYPGELRIRGNPDYLTGLGMVEKAGNGRYRIYLRYSISGLDLRTYIMTLRLEYSAIEPAPAIFSGDDVTNP